MKISIFEPREIEVEGIRLSVSFDEVDTVPDWGRDGMIWNATISESGTIKDWPQGQTFDLHIKVCDRGNYYLIGDGGKEVATREDDYVPCCLPGSFGDYLEMHIDGNGKVEGWPRYFSKANITDSFYPGE